MFALVLRKLLANRWLTLCLLAGFVIGAALLGGIPMYTSGILQRMLTRDLERFQESTGAFTGRYSVSASYYYYAEALTDSGGFPELDRQIRARLAREVGLPILAETRRLTVDFLQAWPAVQREAEPATRDVKIDGLSDAADHVKVLHGRMFLPETDGGPLEVIVTEEAFKELDLLLDEVYVVSDLRDLLGEPLRVKVVGIFGMADPGDPWWFESLANHDISLLADFDLVRGRWADTGSVLLTGSWWSYAFDYHAIGVGDLPMPDTLRDYFERERVLTTTLWFLQVPVLLLGFFIAMTSRLVVRHEANEIAILKSRGARSRQVFLAYLLEGLLLSAAAPSGPGAPGGDDASSAPLEYREPDFARYPRLGGVALATKVFRRDNAIAGIARGSYALTYVMGIVPHEFGVVAWFRPGLLPAHWHQYLNLLAASPNAMLVSEGFAAKYGTKAGDTIEITWEGQGYFDGIVYGIVPYWPTWNPHALDGSGETRELVVANLSYLHAGLALEPYEVWMKLAPGASASDVYRAVADAGVPLLAAESAGAKLVAARNDPLLQGTNGALTLGFTVTLLVAAIGFLVHWIIAMQSRTLQFGVFRAMGLSRARVVGMIAWEQLLVSGAAVGCGAVVGGVAGDLFVPLLQLTASAAEQVPPFHVASDPADYARLFAVAGAFLAIGLAVLTGIAFRIRIAQAIKLGEE